MQDLVINQFSDPDQATDRLRPSDNPYVAPTDNRRGLYDHQLFWRVVKFFFAFIGFLVIMDAVLFAAWMKHGKGYRQAMTPVEQVQKFLTDWQSSPDCYPPIKK